MAFSEEDTRANYIDPLLQNCGWKMENISRQYYFTDGRKLPGNRRGKRKFADYLLKHRNVDLAFIEAKKRSEEPTQGLQQAIEYAGIHHLRFVYASNGFKHYEFDLATGKGVFIEVYPTPDELYNRVTAGANELKLKLLSQPFDESANGRRYFQRIGVNKTLEAVADGRKRILLTLATGTGKTSLAYQLVYKLFHSRWNIDNSERRPKILFLADRNILADQAINTFNPFEKDLIKIDGDEIRRRHGIVPKNANIFFAIYQAIAEKENIGAYYKDYPKDFFDLVIIDECHRGSANEEGMWRDILDYFDTAVHVGLTATPKRRDNVDTCTSSN